MAVDLDAVALDWHTTVTITLVSGTILRLSQQYLILDDNNIYDGRLLSTGELRLSAGRLLEPKIITASMAISFDDADDYFTDLTQSETFAGADVTIEVGNGNAAANYTEVYTGIVKLSGGWEFDQREFRLNLDDARASDPTSLPPNKFFPSTYPNMEEKSYYKSKPLVYGDWSVGVGGGETVPCFQTDSTVGVGGDFIVADHAMKEISFVYKNGASVGFTANGDNSGFTLNVAYDPLTETITCNCKGATDDGLITGNLLQTLPEIMNDILQTWMSVAAGSIDAGALSDWESNLDLVDYGRRVILAETSTNVLLKELLVDGFADMTVQGGKYYPVYRAVPISGLDTFRASDIKADPGGVKKFRVVNDTEDIYANRIVTSYQFSPTTDRFAGSYTDDDAAAQVAVGRVKRRRLSLMWLYTDSGSQGRTQREILAYSTATEAAEMTLGPRALTMVPTDLMYLVYSIYDLGDDEGTPFQVRQINPDYAKLEARIHGWNFLNLVVFHWTADADPTWPLSSALQKGENAFWCDAAGLADPPDAASGGYIWF